MSVVITRCVIGISGLVRLMSVVATITARGKGSYQMETHTTVDVKDRCGDKVRTSPKGFVIHVCGERDGHGDYHRCEWCGDTWL